MKTLNEKIIDELKIIGVNLIPFSCISEKGIRYIHKTRHGELPNRPILGGDLTNMDKVYFMMNSLISASIIMGGILYLFGSATGKNFSPKKWPENTKQRKMEQIHYQQNCYRQEFQSLDKNKDYVIDSTEFIYRE